MSFLDSPFAYDREMRREQAEWDAHLDGLEADHARDEKAQPQLPVRSRDDRRSA